MSRLLLAAAAMAFSNVAVAKPFECHLTDKRECSPSEPCKSIPSNVWLLIDTEAKTYARCNADGCISRTAQVSHAGIWTAIDAPGTSSFAKLSDFGDIVEVVTINSVVLIGYG